MNEATGSHFRLTWRHRFFKWCWNHSYHHEDRHPWLKPLTMIWRRIGIALGP